MTVTYLSPLRVAPDVLVDPDDLDPFEAAGVGDQNSLALGEDGVVGGVPGHPQTLGDAGDGQVLADNRDERPAQCSERQLGARSGGLAEVLPPDVSTLGAPVAAERDEQGRGAPAERLVGQRAGNAVARRPLAAASPAPLVPLQDPAGKDRTVGREPLADDLQTEVVQAATWSGQGARM